MFEWLNDLEWWGWVLLVGFFIFYILLAGFMVGQHDPDDTDEPDEHDTDKGI